LGDLLIERGYVRRQAFEAALTEYLPDRHGRIGDFMVARGVVSREAIERVVEEQRRASGPWGAMA
jgi:adsorption protein B